MSLARAGKLSTLLAGSSPPKETEPTVASTSPPPPPKDPVEDLDSALRQTLEEPRTLEATRIPQSFLADLALKILYYGGIMQGRKVAEAMHLNFNGVVEPILRLLKADHLVEVTGSNTMYAASFQYAITSKGSERAKELLERNRYVGPCPITLRHYTEVVTLQAQKRPLVKEADVRQAIKGLVLAEETIERIGPAVNSGEAIFIYGPPGNGKTSVAKVIGLGLLPGTVMIPHAIFEDGQIIRLFDPETHQAVEGEEAQPLAENQLDKRWVRCTLPIVITGGELTLQDLDLIWSDTSRYYEAPLQLKANGGMFIVDDFGRQKMEPRALLNRWIVPLEERIDFLTFHTGKKFPIPFETLIVFATNLNPTSLVDEAFLRRIGHKLGIDNPTEEQYRQIFTAACEARDVPFNAEAFNHLLRRYYAEVDRPMRACHPRDLLKHLTSFALYRGETPAMTVELVDSAARSYFAELF